MKIYFHGNCQAAALARMVQEVIPDGEITAREIHIEAQFEDRAAYLHDIKTADAIIAQPIRADYQGGFEKSLEFVRREARAGIRIITFPSIYFDGQLPEWSYLRRGGETLPPYQMDYHNLFAFQAALVREDVDAFIARIFCPSLYSPATIKVFIDRAVEALASRERALKTDVVVSDWLCERGYSCQLMSTINHPRRAVLAACANRVLQLLGHAKTIAGQGEDYLALPQIPLLPSVVRYLDNEGDDNLISHFSVGDARQVVMDQESFYRGAYAHYRALPEKQLILAYQQNRDARVFLTSVASQGKPLFSQKWQHLLAYFNLANNSQM